MGKPYYDPKYLKREDPNCRILSRALFAESGLSVVDCGKYDIDQAIYNDSDFYAYLELEYAEKHRFRNGEYYSPQQKAVSIPLRKRRYDQLNELWFWMNIASDYKHYIILSNRQIKMLARLREYKVYNNTNPEPFYVIPQGLVHINMVPMKILKSIGLYK